MNGDDSTEIIARPIGQMALHSALGLRRPLPFARSFTINGNRRTKALSDYVEEYYPLRYQPEESIQANLRFALKYEPLDLGIIVEALKSLGAQALENLIATQPTSIYLRRMWFFYETFTGDTLDIPADRSGNYVDALDPKRHHVSSPSNSPRHGVRDNLLGGPYLCPTVRRSAKLDAWSQADLSTEAKEQANRFAPELVARAVDYLYTKETRSSFAIEGETPGQSREQRFVHALRHFDEILPLTKPGLIRLQNTIVDPRYAASDWRSIQNFVSETTRGFHQHVHFICPKPEDVEALMWGWSHLSARMLTSGIDPVVAAAVSAFTFVFVHPFEDGNGRIHRFLIHAILSQLGFMPEGIIFPVSAAIHRQQKSYDKVLEQFSQPLLMAADWKFGSDGRLLVENDTRSLYQFYDATPQVEFLFERVAETIRVDFRDELEFLKRFDQARRVVREIIDMPNQHADRLIKLIMQNSGTLSKTKRGQFPELTDDEVARIEEGLQKVMGSEEA
jgi:Fic family protein